MIFLSYDEIITLHDKLISKTGGLCGLRDSALLESAVFSINASFDEVEVYPSVEEKSARLAYSLINNHAFLDGNKRIGILATLMTLTLNDIKITYTQQELVEVGLSVASGKFAYEAILNWINSHKE